MNTIRIARRASRWLGVLVCVFCISLAGRAPAAVVEWDGNTAPPFTNGGLWSDPLNWSPDGVPASTDDVFLSDILTGGDIVGPGLVGPEHPAFNIFDTISRQVFMDVPGATVNSVLIQEFPFPPTPTVTGAPHRNVLTLDDDLTSATNVTLSGSRAILDLNGQTVTANNVVVDAPVFEDGHYWFRNRIGDNVSLNDGLDADLPASLASPYSLAGPSNPYGIPFPGSFNYSWGSAFPVLPYGASNLLYVPDMTAQVPLPFSTNTLGGPNGATSGATSGTIHANLDSQGMVWLNGISTVVGKTNNHSAFGYFRYDSGGVAANLINFGDDVTSSDQHAIMDVNGRAFYAGSVTNKNLSTMYMRSRTDIRNQWTNQSGGQFLFQPTVAGSNPNDPDGFTGNLFRLNRDALNDGYAFATNAYPPPTGKPGDPPPGNISAPYHPGLNPGLIGGTPGSSPTIVGGIPGYATSAIFPFASQADFDGDVIYRDTGNPNEVLDFHNSNGAIMTMRGNVNLGLIDRTPTADLPNKNIIDRSLDRIATLRNDSGGFYTYQPRNPAAQSMDITGEIVNDGALALPIIAPVGDPQFVDIHSVMNIFGNTVIRGRFLPTRPSSGVLLTNTNGAILNYNAQIDVGYDQLPNDSWIDVPHGNLDNTNGTINGFGAGKLIFHGGNQVNNGTITLSDQAQFFNGRQGTSTFTNNGTLASVVYSGPAPSGYNPAALTDSPTMNAGIVNNYGLIQANASTTLNLNSAPVNNFATGTIDLNGGTLNPLQGTVNYGTTTFNGGAIQGPFFLNLPGALINGGPGGAMNASVFVNSTGASMSLGDGSSAALQINSSTFTQAGDIDVADEFNVVANNTSFTNSGTITMNGPDANLAAPGRTIFNQGTIQGSGVLGGATPFAALTKQVVNVSAASIDVGPGDSMDIDGALMPENSGTINITGPSASVGIVAGGVGDVFHNSGNIFMSDADFNDRALGRGFQNDQVVSGNGFIDFATGFLNSGTGSLTATGGDLTLNDGNAGSVDNFGLATIDVQSSLIIPNAPFTNNGHIDMNGDGATLTNDNGNNGFVNAVGADLHAFGDDNVIDFADSINAASVINNGRIALTGTPTGSLSINPTSNQDFINNGDLFVDPSSVTIGNVGLGGSVFINNGTTELVSSSLSARSITNTGSIVATGAPPAGFAVTAVGGFDNTGGSFQAQAGADFLTGDFINDGGLLSVVGGTNGTTSDLSNGSAGGAVGTVRIDSKSSLSTSSIDNDGGNIVVDNGSTLSTNNNAGGAFGDLTSTAAGITVGGGSLLDVGTVTQDGGIVHIGGGARADTLDYTNTGGTLSLFNAPNLAGAFTLDTSATILNPFALSILGGDFTLNGGASAIARGDFQNASSTSLQAASLLRITGNMTNHGQISVDASTITTLGADGDDNSEGSIVAVNGSTLAFKDKFDNTAGLFSLNASNATTGDFTNDFLFASGNGDVVLEGESVLKTGLFTNSGDVVIGSGSRLRTDVSGAFAAFNISSGTVTVADADSFWDVGTVSQTNGSVRIQGGAQGDAALYTLTGGTVTLSDPSSDPNHPTLRVGGGNFTSAGSVLMQKGATFRAPKFLNNSTNATFTMTDASLATFPSLGDNLGSIDIESGSILTTINGAVFSPFKNTMTGTVTVAGANSELRVADTTNDGHFAVNQAALVTLFNGGALTNTGTFSLDGANSKVDIGGSLNNNAGTVTAARDSTITVGNSVNNAVEGQIALNFSTLDAQVQLANSGDFTLSNNSIATFRGMGVTHTNNIDGNIDVNTSSQLIIPLAATGVSNLKNDGSIRVSTAGFIQTNGVTNTGTIVVNDPMSSFEIGKGNYVGTGRVNIANNGQMTVDSDYRMGPGAFLSVDQAGTQLTATGNIVMTGVVGNRAVIKVNNKGAVTAANLILPPEPGPGPFNNAGNAVRVDPAFMTILHNANFNPQDIFETDYGSYFDLGGNFDNAQQVAKNWTFNGRFTLNGGGASNQMIEVAGHDFGNTTSPAFPSFNNLFDAAYIDNYAVGDRNISGLDTLFVTANSLIQFVNNRDNLNGSSGGTDDFATQPFGQVITSTGALAGGEAMYVDRLVIDDNAKLNLGLLHVYYRQVSFDDGLSFVTGKFSDVNFWLSHGVSFFAGSDGVTRYPIPFAVPEPCSLLLACLGALAIATYAARFARPRGFRSPTETTSP